MADDPTGGSDDTPSINGHPRVGFDPDVCKGCPMRVTSVNDVTDDMDPKVKKMARTSPRSLRMMKPCGFCGCPTIRGLPMHLSGAPPSDCIRLSEHKRKG